MRFWIQAGNPISLRLPGRVVDDLSEAIETIFPTDTEDAILVWNHSYIPVNYKYDLSVMIDDLLPLLTSLLERSSGRYKVTFGSNTFSTEWNLTWAEGGLSISAAWQSVVGNVDAVSSDCGSLKIRVEDFLFEWKEVLIRLKTALDKGSLSITNREDYESLIKIESSINRSGRLYQRLYKE
jgi:hypothetical protein